MLTFTGDIGSPPPSETTTGTNTGSGGSGDDGGGDRRAEESRDLGSAASERERKREVDRAQEEDAASEEGSARSVYVVKQGDTLGGIAEKTGVPVEQLQDLNPGLDQFSLVAGQRIKLK